MLGISPGVLPKSQVIKQKVHFFFWCFIIQDDRPGKEIGVIKNTSAYHRPVCSGFFHFLLRIAQ